MSRKVRLPVHLPRQQIIRFEVGMEAAAYNDAATEPTKLDAFFALNQARLTQHAAAQALVVEAPLYQDIPLHYIWRDNKWQERQRQSYSDRVIGRVYAA